MKKNPADFKQTQLILVRGLTREARHWGELPHLLQQAWQRSGERSLRVDCLDLPGCGQFSEMRSPTHISEITAFVREKFTEVRASDDVHLVAISLGGMVATEWLSEWPDDFRSCVLINTSFKGFSPFHHRLSFNSYAYIMRALLSSDPLVREKQIVRMVSNRPELYTIAAEAWKQIQLTRPVSVENFARQLLAAARFQPKLAAPSLPVLVIGSLGDRMVNPRCSEEIARRWSAQLRQHANAGHDIPLDDPMWLVEQIHSWWSGL